MCKTRTVASKKHFFQYIINFFCWSSKRSLMVLWSTRTLAFLGVFQGTSPGLSVPAGYLGVWEVVFFPVPEEIVYSFFSILFDIFWDSIDLAYVSKLGEEGLVYDYLFTSQEETYSVPDMDCPIWSYEKQSYQN